MGVKAEVWCSLLALLSSSVGSPVGLLQKKLKRGANRGAFSTHYHLVFSSPVYSPVGLLQKRLNRGANRGEISTHYHLYFPPRLTPRLGFCRRGSTGVPTGG